MKDLRVMMNYLVSIGYDELEIARMMPKEIKTLYVLNRRLDEKTLPIEFAEAA